ncbi:MAG: hypothetical protein U5N86_09970 [Planctomycetota bacterium]|nr:hypothetical protein [Planctomycetota bacterium]
MTYSGKIYAVLAFTAALMLAFSFSSAEEDKKEKDPRKFRPAREKEDTVKLKDEEFKEPLHCAYLDFVKYGILGSVNICGFDVQIDAMGDEGIKVSWNDQAVEIKSSPKVIRLERGEEDEKELYKICFINDEKRGWGYFNAVYYEGKFEEGNIRFYDMNCNGQYLDRKVDAVMYGESDFVSPIMPVVWYYDWNIELKMVDGKRGKEMEVKYNPLMILPDERKAGVVLNEFRMNIGLPAVPLDEELCDKAREYAAFIDLQGADMADWDIVQNPQPGHQGYTPACSEMKRSYFFCFDGAVTAIGDMFRQFYHRAQFFFPDTKKFAIGAKGAISVFNGELTRDPDYMSWNYPILVPAPEQTISHFSYYGKYGGETPDPRPSGGGSFPISLIFDDVRGKEIKVLEHKLSVVKGRNREEDVGSVCFWPGRPAHPSQPDNAGQILIMAERAFKRKSRYHVYVKYTIGEDEFTSDWYFNTSRR